MDKAISESSCVRPKAFDLISDALPFGRLCYGRPDFLHEHAGDFKEWSAVCSHQITHAIKHLFGLLPPGLVAKTLLQNNSGEAI
jgi:hypothetical protein